MQRKARRRFGKQPRGFILVLTLAFAALLGVASVLAIGPSVGEALKAGQELRDQRLFFLADGGATLCRGELKSRLTSALPTKLAALPPLTVGMLTNFKTTYVDGNDPAGFLVDYAYDPANAALLGGAWTKDSTTQAHVQVSYEQYRCTLTVTSRGAPVSSVSALGSTALFRYRYTIDGTGTEGSVTRTVRLQGTFSVLVQQDNFARYILFTNDQRNSSGSPVYFGPGFSYHGPVRTNGQFNFMQNPSSSFWDTIESGSTTARYLNSPGSPIELAADRNGTIDVPIFDKGLTLGAAAIPMPTTTTADAQKSTALTGLSAPSSTGVYLGASGTAMTGGIYVKGDASISLATAGTRSAQYRITVGSTTWTVTADYNTMNTTVTQTAPTTWVYDTIVRNSH